MPAIATGHRHRELPGGLRYDAADDRGILLEKVIDRALLALVVSMEPDYITRGGTAKPKTLKRRQIEDAELKALLRLMTADLHITAGDGDTEFAVRLALYRLGTERGLICEHYDDGPRWRLAVQSRDWALWDVMSGERRRSEYPHRTRSQGSG